MERGGKSAAFSPDGDKWKPSQQWDPRPSVTLRSSCNREARQRTHSHLQSGSVGQLLTFQWPEKTRKSTTKFQEHLTEASRPVCGSARRRDPLRDVSAPHLPADSDVLQEKLFSRSSQKTQSILVLSRLIRQPSAWEQQKTQGRRIFIEPRTRIHRLTSASVFRKPSPGGYNKNPSVESET